MKSIIAKVIQFLAKVFGLSTIPPEVAGSDQSLMEWWAVYRCKAPWLKYDYVTADGKKRTRKRFTLNMAKVVTSEMAGLIFAENPEITSSKLVEDLFKRENLFDNLKKSTEYMGALGGQVLKLGSASNVDAKGNTSATLFLDYVKATNFIPLSWDNSEVTEASFFDRRVIKGTSLVRVETHKKNPAGSGYIITQKAFREDTGVEVPLSQFDENLKEEVTVTGITRPLFAYIRNPEANNIEPESPLGISIFANAMDTLQALDLAFDGMKTEVLLGRQRIAVPGTVMRTYPDPETGKKVLGFDPTDEAYVRFEGDDIDKMKISDLSGELRMDQYKTGIQTLLDILSVQVGFSAGYFSFDGVSVKTATEVVSDNSKTYKTMQSIREAIDEALKHIAQVANELGKSLNIQGTESVETNIAWDDSVIEDRNSRAKYFTDLAMNKLVDKVTALQKIHGIDEKQAEKMFEKIKKETATVNAETLFGVREGAV